MDLHLHLKRIELGRRTVELFVPDEDQIKEWFEAGDIIFPVWAQVWPSSVALSSFILDHPEYIKDQKVIELGAGLGLCSLIAASLAGSVLCSDKEAAAVGIITRSAEHNGLRNIVTATLDWNSITGLENFDLLLLSDVNYDPVTFPVLLDLVTSFLDGGGTVLLSTPQRLSARSFILPLLAYTGEQQTFSVPHKQEVVHICVHVLRKHH